MERNTIAALFLCLFCLYGANAQTYISMRPNWTFNAPKAENSSYEYYVSKGVGDTEKEARKDAFVIAVKEAQSRVGVGTNAAEIFAAFQKSDKDFNVIADDYSIPMREVCSFSEKNRDGKYNYYQLLQIAIRGNVVPIFQQFTGDCYDFSKAKELRGILKEEYKDQIAAQKRAENETAKQATLAAYKKYDITYSEFCYNKEKYMDDPNAGYYLKKSQKINSAGHWMWFLPAYTALGVGMGVGLADGIDKEKKLPIIFGAIGASCLPSLLCYSIAPAYKRKAWRTYRSPYDNALKDLKKSQRGFNTLQVSPVATPQWAGVNVRVTFE